ncbi:glycosyltransferase [Sporolactobacillus spathodeae]|uniref:UDP-N-acetylglucosamine transferase subunit ALG13 n=1 Tax=Sporolactobacillus spathodeae TaxID=1465502 RepID=A0ABS2QBJ5_9BACL|nr:glycosyltransferase [Sporolactobacillus spathodeae]MBM7659144.1 UDP-N-acetylglucosamine transferase subunit ALG13 [Sporolactobacillus spathodeae]
MIHYIVGRNLGHLNPCVANLSEFSKLSDEPVKIYSFSNTHEWLRANFPQGNIAHYLNPQKRADQLLNANLVMHDWRDEVLKLKKERTGQGPIIGGIYHSDMSVTSADTDWTRKFKWQIRDISQKSTDIFFHINLTQPKEIPQLSTLYVPIPIITRDLTMTPEQVKQMLGIPSDEPFILVQMGGGVGKYRYLYMDEWYEKVNKLQTPYRLVVANQLRGIAFSFQPQIIQAPLFANGRDLINAADLVISKPGMGILMDCLSTGTPLLALPADTKEREVKNRMLLELVGDDRCLASPHMTPKDLAIRIEELRAQKAHFENVFGKIPQNGAAIIAESMKLLSGRKLKELPDVYQDILNLTPFVVH